MQGMFKKIFKSLPLELQKILYDLSDYFTDHYVFSSYSQEGEDMVLLRAFGNQRNGFFVDVGAHHPKRFSNTYIFYKYGWRGINIEPNPNSIAKFNKVRPEDINIQLGVSSNPGILTYYIFNDPALNTFDKTTAESRVLEGEYHIIRKESVAVERLDKILKLHLRQNTSIDFLSIDVEGLDLEVLKSNDWDLFRPKVVLVEELGMNLEDLSTSPVVSFMRKNNYKFFAKTYNTLFFEDKNQFITMR